MKYSDEFVMRQIVLSVTVRDLLCVHFMHRIAALPELPAQRFWTFRNVFSFAEAEFSQRDECPRLLS